MNKEHTELLLKDLCARLPYHPILHFIDKVQQEDEYLYGFRENGGILQINDAYYVDEVKPYLRSMSSMTDEEWNEYDNMCDAFMGEGYCELIDWLNAHHFDYRNLIKEGLAIEASEEMYN